MDGTASVTNPPSLSLPGKAQLPVAFSSPPHHHLLLQQHQIKDEDQQPLPIGNEHADPDSTRGDIQISHSSAFSYTPTAFLGNGHSTPNSLGAGNPRNCFYDPSIPVSIASKNLSSADASGEFFWFDLVISALILVSHASNRSAG